jgi:hypothetical protein
MLCSVDAAVTNVSGQPVGPKMLVTNYRSTWHNIPEEAKISFTPWQKPDINYKMKQLSAESAYRQSTIT